VAVILGIVLLQQFDDGIDTGAGQVAATSIPATVDQPSTSTTRRVGLTTVPQTTPTTGRARTKAEVIVVVANGAGVRGLGAATTNALKNVGYTTLTPTDASGAVDKTSIQFVEGYEAEARELAGVIGQPATVVTRLANPPVAASEIADAKVVVVLGVDVTSSTTTSVAGAVTTTTRRP